MKEVVLGLVIGPLVIGVGVAAVAHYLIVGTQCQRELKRDRSNAAHAARALPPATNV